MNQQYTPDQIFDLLTEVPGTAEDRDAALTGIEQLRGRELQQLRNRIVQAAQPGSKDHERFEVPYVRGYLLGQLGKFTGADSEARALVLKHLKPEQEPDSWVRFWTFSGCVQGGFEELPELAQEILNRYEEQPAEEDFKSMLLANAFFANQKQEAEFIERLQAPLVDKQEEEPHGGIGEQKQLQVQCQDALRVLGLSPVPILVDEIIQVMQHREVATRTLFLAVKALGRIPRTHQKETGKAVQALIHFLETSGNTRGLSSARREALWSLGNLKGLGAEPVLMKILRRGDLNLIPAAARALGEALGLKQAIERILEVSIQEPTPRIRKNFGMAMRWLAENEVEVAKALERELERGNPGRQENTRHLLREMGGEAAMMQLDTHRQHNLNHTVHNPERTIKSGAGSEFVDRSDLKSKILAASYFHFYISEDEERISIKIVGPDWEMDLGDRAHNYLLLVLIRKKLEDHETGYVEEDRGWISMDDLTEDMAREARKDIDAYHVNVLLHRMRKQLEKIKPHGPLFLKVIQRRRGELRFAHRYYRILKANRTVWEVLPGQVALGRV